MKLGIFAKTFNRPTVEEVFDAVAAHGLHCVQFNFACAGRPSLPDAVEPALLERIRRAADARQVSIAAVSGTFNMIHPDLQRRREGLRQLNVIAGACAQLGANLVTLCTGTRDPKNMWRSHPANASAEAWHDLIHAMSEALAIAEQHEIMLGVEPETANVIDSARRARRLLDECQSPRLKIILDAANLFHPGDLIRMADILDEAFALLGRDLGLAHGKELGRDGHAGHLPLGAGVLDWGRYLSLLHQAHYNGPLVLHGFEEEHVPASFGFVRGKLLATGPGQG